MEETKVSHDAQPGSLINLFGSRRKLCSTLVPIVGQQDFALSLNSMRVAGNGNYTSVVPGMIIAIIETRTEMKFAYMVSVDAVGWVRWP
jgi:hypothetical protein